ncbi:MAG: hypothetical protein M1821_009437 [Bathelium mastoideum]|nr:MAG: hypothetical protein M1821_009437 [Bathelium mastoideum]
MRTAAAVLSLALSTLVQALPLAEQKRQAPAYSVVPVDGGSSVSPSTVVQTLPASTQTITSTSIVTESESESTILVTSTTTASPSTQTVKTTVTHETSEPVPTLPGFTYSATETSISSLTATATDSVTTSEIEYSTITESPFPTSTSYYDDGLWHTYYPVKDFTTSSPWNGTVTVEKRAETGWSSYAAATPVYTESAPTSYASYEPAIPEVPTYVRRAAAGYALPEAPASAIGKRGHASSTLNVRNAAVPESSSLPLLQKYENGNWETIYAKPVNSTVVTPVRRAPVAPISTRQEANDTSPFIPAIPVSSKSYHVVSYDSPSYNVTEPWKS